MTLIEVKPEKIAELARDLADATQKVAGIQSKMLINNLPEITLNFDTARRFVDHVASWARKADIECDAQVTAKKREALTRETADREHKKLENQPEAKPNSKRKHS